MGESHSLRWKRPGAGEHRQQSPPPPPSRLFPGTVLNPELGGEPASWALPPQSRHHSIGSSLGPEPPCGAWRLDTPAARWGLRSSGSKQQLGFVSPASAHPPGRPNCSPDTLAHRLSGGAGAQPQAAEQLRGPRSVHRPPRPLDVTARRWDPSRPGGALEGGGVHREIPLTCSGWGFLGRGGQPAARWPCSWTGTNRLQAHTFCWSPRAAPGRPLRKSHLS